MTKNYIKLRKWSPLYQHYVYIDYADKSLADQVFIAHQVPVHFMADYVKDGEPYSCVFCKVKKRYADEFERCVQQFADSCDKQYAEFCKRFTMKINEAKL